MPTSGLYKISTIAQRTGLSTTLIRAWERRHNFLAPIRTPSGHRLYTENDLQMLLRVRRLMAEGLSISEAVARGRQSVPAAPPPPTPDRAAPELERLAAEAVEAALQLDERALTRTLDRGFALVAWETVLDDIVIPVARTIGELWSRNVASVACEHLMTRVFTSRLNRLIETEATRLGRGRSALCACLPDESHELGCLAVAYQLTRLGWRVTYLGAALPLEDLEEAILLRQPELVFLSVTRPNLLPPQHAPLVTLAARRGVVIILGGEGTRNCAPAPGVHVWKAGRPLSELEDALVDTSL